MILRADALAAIADTFDIIGIMQRRIGDNDTADGDRGETRDRRQGAGTSHLNFNVLNRRECLLGREFMRGRPARAARAEAQSLLKVEPVDLIDHTVDIIIEIGPRNADFIIMFKQLLGGGESLHQRIDREAPFPELLDDAVLRIGNPRRLAAIRNLTQGIGKEPEFAFRRHIGVELAQRTGCRVARVHIGLLAFGLHLGVERHEVALGHIDLTTNLHHIGRVRRQLVRDFLDGPDIGGDVFARRAVTTRRRGLQPAVLVADRHGKPVDLRLGGKGDGIIRQMPEEAIDRTHEIPQILFRKRIVERQHRPRMHDWRKGRKRREADFLRWAIGPHQRWKSRLDGIVAPLQRIIIGVRNLRRVLAVIKGVMASKLGRQKCELGRGFKLGEVFDGFLVFRHDGLFSELPNAFSRNNRH
ncbi:hypothetical protein D3C80_530270 [compost metagenome]